jgi:GNAT superfamily N-acetyltransferase
MKARCFACDAMVQADDTDGVEDAFVVHGRQSHDWSCYPEKAIRTYARNDAEARERLTGATERLEEIGRVSIRPVTGDQVADWLYLFGHEAFAGDPSLASCYCLGPHRPPTKEEPERPWREARAEVIARLRSGRTLGYLAYVDGKAAGWVNASLRAEYLLFRDVNPDGPAPESVIGVSCFVVAPPFRRHGIATMLLDHVISEGATRGVAWIEGYPHHEPVEGDGGHFRGTRSMYLARGFEAVEVREHETVFRRRLDTSVRPTSQSPGVSS